MNWRWKHSSLTLTFVLAMKLCDAEAIVASCVIACSVQTLARPEKGVKTRRFISAWYGTSAVKLLRKTKGVIHTGAASPIIGWGQKKFGLRVTVQSLLLHMNMSSLRPAAKTVIYVFALFICQLTLSALLVCHTQEHAKAAPPSEVRWIVFAVHNVFHPSSTRSGTVSFC